MPVITHRRVNEMRGSRRRLSVGAVGGVSAAPFFATRQQQRGSGGSSMGASPKDCTLERNSPLKTLSSSLPSTASPEMLFGLFHPAITPPATPPPPPVLLSSQASQSEGAGASNSMTSADTRPSAFGGAVPRLSAAPAASPALDISCIESDPNSDDEARNEPLPTPEQLILSQSWSTWPTSCHHLYSGSKFSGTQSNGTRSYTVTVTLKYVDMGVPELCGHFTIRGLTNELPKLTTFFDAQIVGSSSNSFVTSQWDATVDTDRTHWSFFPAFRQHRSRFDCSDFKYRLSASDKYIFMRWKERFVVPNYKLSRINGASYDGFYYVCYDREDASITGYYFHRDSDHYQCLKLSHTKQTTFSHFELA
ncbi:GID complex subunit 4, VID24 [Coemansia sp. BCRC 34301]|nr:GID complex subunit 4, VID24 [Coemansia sp. BCRC 34301]